MTYLIERQRVTPPIDHVTVTFSREDILEILAAYKGIEGSKPCFSFTFSTLIKRLQEIENL